MKRIDGFLDLDKHFNNTLKSVTNNVIDGDYAHQYWMIIDGEKYFFKITDNPYAELLAYEVANLLGIDATPYDLAIYRKQEGVISKSYRKENCRYISGRKILESYANAFSNQQIIREMGFNKQYRITPSGINNLEIIWQAIEYRYNNLNIEIDIEQIMKDLINQFIVNVLISQTDGLPHNWELEEDLDNKKVQVVAMFDNECSFSEKIANSSFATNFNDAGKNNYDILEEFLNVSSKEFVGYFVEKFNALTIEKFMEIIHKVEIKIGAEIPEIYKNTYIEVFDFNRKQIEDVLNKKGLNQMR